MRKYYLPQSAKDILNKIHCVFFCNHTKKNFNTDVYNYVDG